MRPQGHTGSPVDDSTPRDAARALIEAYLPRTLIERVARRSPEDSSHWSESLEGTLMHCDMSGFTAMSERLARLGREGAELMAGVLNRFFERMLGIADGWGGLQMKFGGDAMLLLFDGDGHEARAAACGLDMQRAMPEFRNVQAGGEGHRLKMRAGMHSGTFLAVSAGMAEEGTLHYLLLGPQVQRAAAVEAAAKPGQVVASEETATRLEGHATLVRSGEVWRVSAVEAPDRPPQRGDASAAPSTELRRYLMPPFAVPLAEGREPHYGAEHRRVTAVFVSVLGVAELLAAGRSDDAVRQIDAFVRLTIAALDRHGGFLAGSDAGEHYDKLIAIFGAPVSSERDEAGALRFALDLERALAETSLDLRHAVGVSTGFVFAGEIGSRTRREYTVIGDSVNLSARLMTAAPIGQIYVSSPTAARAGNEFALTRLRPMRVKGKAAPVQAFRLTGASAAAPVAVRRTPAALLARDDELRALTGLAARAGREGSRWAFVSGEPGIGKSALIDAAASRLADEGWLLLTAHCQAHRQRDVFAAWHEPLRTLFGISLSDQGEEAVLMIDAEVARLATDSAAFSPLISSLLGLPAEEGPLLRFLDARARRQRLTALLRELLTARAQESPVLLVFDDVHVCDDPSLELLVEVLESMAAPLCVIVTSRTVLRPDVLRETEPDLTLELRELSRESARALAASLAQVDGATLDALLDRAQGNPLFVQELAMMSDAGGDMPESVNDVIVARLDRLPAEERIVLRAAAVAGTTFRDEHVRALVADRLDGEAIAGAMERLARGGFTVADGERGAHAFRHPLTQEVIYEALPFVQRRALHGTLAEHIEGNDGAAGESGVLLHHYDRAGNAPKTVVYATYSGDRAARTFANREAIDYYTRGLTALEATGDASESDRSVLLERIGLCLETQGRHAAATEALSDAVMRWRKRKGARRRRLLLVDVPEKAREAALCRRVAVSYERSSLYDDALSWLEDALRALPPRAGRVAAEVLGAKAATLYRKGEYREAIEWGRRSLSTARRIGDPAVIAYAENMLGNPYMAEGALRDAARHWSEAVRLYDEIGDEPGRAAANNNLGTCYQLMGLLDASRKHYQIALEADERVGDHVDMAIIHNNIGEILLIQGQLDEAAAYLERVLEAHRQADELTAVTGLSYVNLCRVSMARGDLDQAMRHVRHGMRLLRGVGALGLVTEARMQLAELLLAQGDLTRAQRESQRALRDAMASGDRLLEARGERIVGLVRARAGGIDAAAIRIATSAGLARKIGASHEEARSLLALARLRLDTAGRPRTTGLRRALSIFRRMGAAPEVAEAERQLARLEGLAPATA